ncbi:MAG: endo-1,3-alpha-glucanase family glycosylhydrolase [Ardenticatenaceae bacterium]
MKEVIAPIIQPKRSHAPRNQKVAGASLRWLSGTLLALLMSVLAIALVLLSSATDASAAPPPQEDGPPILAYYYIWFDPSSWDRAKTDYPLLGRYSSDESAIMEQHIQWAKRAGIDGFIVSWKSNDKLNSRLEKLVQVADEEDFNLVIIYQGLDFDRNPLLVEKVESDLEYFNEKYANHSVFDMFGKPVVIWSGTWKFSREEIEQVSQSPRDFYLLSSEKNVEGYERLADIVDGDAYYWSSVALDTPGYAEKLIAMSEAIHARDGIWIAPAAPGFDAQILGGTRVIERNDGDTLLEQLKVASQSAPDAIGLISWNEFSENSQVEPSEEYGIRALQVLADSQGRVFPPLSETKRVIPIDIGYGMPLLVAVILLFSLSIVALVRRQKVETVETT